jgi:hypothetical protein
MHPKDQYDTEALSLAAPAPRSAEDQEPPQTTEDGDLDDLCERWVSWCSSRRFYAPAPTYVNILGQMSGTSKPVRPTEPDAPTSPELMALHLAYLGQPDALDKRVFDLYYVYRIRPIKRAADALKISRKHFYTVLRDFRRRLRMAAKGILSGNEAARDALPHFVGCPQSTDRSL